MPVDRPTFSESWYRVADLRPRLRSTVQIHRQHFRGQMWHVVQDPGSNQFFRLNEAAYQFAAMLDGRRTVSEVWQSCNERLGDAAPTQGEAIQLLGQLYSSNLLQAELPPDAEGLFNRYRKRVRREVQGYLMNLLFVRIPLLDPDHFLDRWVGVFGKLYTWYGFVGWLILLAAGLSFVAGSAGELVRRASGVLEGDNLLPLYASFILVAVFHEFSHAFACKRFGKASGSGGEVHVMGIMFLVFVPKPYVDASSSWAFRSKWNRVVVGSAGIMTELAIASIAAIVWTQTSEGLLKEISYNVMFLASVSTILFNGNPLLRYDGYYILSDLVEIANLGPRSKQYLFYLVKRYAWGVKRLQNPANTRGERYWLASYAVTSTVYRFFIWGAILLFVAKKFFMVGIVLALGAVITWVFVPIGKFIHYLGTSGELMRARGRAVGSTVAVVAGILIAIGLVPAPDRFRAEGVVDPVGLEVVYMRTDGFVREFLPSGQAVEPGGEPLIVAENRELQAEYERLTAELHDFEARERLAQTEDIVRAQALAETIAAQQERMAEVAEQIGLLKVTAPLKGTWVSPQIERAVGAYFPRGEKIGLVASLDDLIIRATASQDVATLIQQAQKKVEIRLKGQPNVHLSGMITQILPAGERLPSEALAVSAGGTVATNVDDRGGTTSAERFYEVHIAPDSAGQIRLITGQRVVVRFEAPAKPLMVQWWRSLLQLVQRRFHI